MISDYTKCHNCVHILEKMDYLSKYVPHSVLELFKNSQGVECRSGGRIEARVEYVVSGGDPTRSHREEAVPLFPKI